MGIFGSQYRKLAASLYGTGISKIPLVKNIHGAISKHTTPEFITIFGYKMFLDKTNMEEYCVVFDSETEMTRILQKWIKKGDTVIDVGANIGFYTLLFRNLVGDTGKVIAFEPEPKNFALLKKTISVNKFENIDIYQKGVGRKNMKLKMLLSDKIGEHNISDDGDIEIDCVRLDDHFNFADFIKLDVEGYEIEVIKGMPNLLNQQLTLMSEFYLKLLIKYSDPVEFFKILKNNSFSFHDMRNNMQSIDESNYMLNYDEKSSATDILCVKND